MKPVCIIGLGLIGGSLAHALKADREVIGVEIHPESKRLAQQQGFTLAKDLAEGVSKAGLVIICTPLGQIPRVIAQVAAHLPADAVVTDVGSAKQAVLKAAHQYLPDGRFVGGHPMAGTENHGLANAVPELFSGRTWILTPENDSERAAMATVQAYLEPLGCHWLEMDPSDHDLAVAYASHLPFLMATAVARSAQGAIRDVPELPKVASSGFRDTTRLAASNPVLGRDICLMNRDAILHAIAAMRYQLAQFEILLQSDTTVGLEALFDGVGQWRRSLNL